MYWDRKNNRWDDTLCQPGGDQRCVPMDCHLENSTFALLGYYKEVNMDDWMEQLFKHEGYCIWTPDEYSFMSSYRESWPRACVQTGAQDENGNTIYLDTKPTQGGGMELGMYTDYRCSKDYTGDELTLDTVLSSNNNNEGGGGGHGHGNYGAIAQYTDVWNDAFDIYHYCQPCVAYNLYNILSNGNDDGNGGGDVDIDCSDVAGYTNVNQWYVICNPTQCGCCLLDCFLTLSLYELQHEIQNKDGNENSHLQ
jgi:hypothetical protein